MILLVFAFGFENISLAVADYYNYDKITNIERVTPKDVIFPAITIFAKFGLSKKHYRNGSLITNNTDFSRSLFDFLNRSKTHFSSYDTSSQRYNQYYNLSNHLDYFKTTQLGNQLYWDCLRFNAITNKNVELFKAGSTKDEFRIFLNSFYVENISIDEYFNFTFNPSFFYFYVYIGDNSLNHFENLQYFRFDIFNDHLIEIQKESIEIKLPEPYNPCKKSSVDERYHQMNCIEACTYKEIKNKYNCSYNHTLFTIKGLQECKKDSYKELKLEFSATCLKECSLESCFSEKFTQQVEITQNRFGLTSFSFSFRDLSSLNITQIPKTDVFTYINNIGGGLGLFMGIAFPNLIEFLQFIFEIVSIIFS